MEQRRGARRRGRWQCAVLCAVWTASVPGARAQDMVFTVEETGQPAPPPADGPPSEALANALRLYQQERYPEAAVQLQRVVEGETTDTPGNLQKAEFFLAKTLYHLQFYQSSLAIFDEITQRGASHHYFAQSLPWLAQLAAQLPEPAGIIERVGRYGPEQLAQFDTPESAGLYDQLTYLLGRHHYAQGEFDAAVELFRRVRRDSDYYVNARFFEGVSHVRMRRAQPAIAAYRAIVEALDRGARVEDPQRMRDLAWLSLARIYYTAANRTDEAGDRQVDGRLLGNAVEAWNRIGAGSEYWLDALFEQSWALFLADEYARAMGHIHTLLSPYFEDGYYPEALVLKAVMFFSACQTANAEAIIAQFHERYDPVQSELSATLSRFDDNQQFFDFLVRVRTGEADLSPRIRGIVSTALSDRTLLRHLEYVRVLDAEEARLSRMPAELRASGLGSRILQDTAVARSFAVDQTGVLARGRYRRLIAELEELMTQMDTVEVELTRYIREETLSAEGRAEQPPPNARGLNVEVDEEHQIWPFDGEYWRDELGSYRQQVTSRCGR